MLLTGHPSGEPHAISGTESADASDSLDLLLTVSGWMSEDESLDRLGIAGSAVIGIDTDGDGGAECSATASWSARKSG